MALVVPIAKPSLDTSGMAIVQISGDLYAGEALLAAAPCYIKSDGKAWMSNGTAANAAAAVDGWTPCAYAVGEAVTLIEFPRFGYSTGLTPGATYYVAATAGRLDTAATTGDAVGVARAINATDIRGTRAA